MVVFAWPIYLLIVQQCQAELLFYPSPFHILSKNVTFFVVFCPIRFVHPYPFAGCENEEKVGLRQIYPQHLLEDPLLIKAELDRLHQGYEALEVNVREKVFYPEPQVFTNISTLSIWGNMNLRYGSSTTRNSSFVPAIRSELSEGLYKYQRAIVTGTAPMPYSVHEEPQTQFYYAMKSGY